MHLRPLGTRVLINVEPASAQIGLIHIPEQAQRTPQEGIVVAVGKDVTEVVIGDRILFTRVSTLAVGERVFIWEDQILGVLE